VGRPSTERGWCSTHPYKMLSVGSIPTPCTMAEMGSCPTCGDEYDYDPRATEPFVAEFNCFNCVMNGEPMKPVLESGPDRSGTSPEN